MAKREPSCTVGGKVNWCGHYGKHYGDFSTKLKIELPHDPGVPLLGVYQKKSKTLIQKDICTPGFAAALFATAKIWKQPSGPLVDEWMQKMWHADTMEYYSAIKKNEILPCVTQWMDLEHSMLNKMILTEKHKYHMISLTCGI